MREQSSSIPSNCQRGLFLTLLMVIAIALLLPAALLGQGYFGTVSGLLTDSSEAVIQGAKVTLTDEQKGYQFTTTSESSGRYLFVSIPPGMYSVTAEMKGFEKEDTHTHQIERQRESDGQPDAESCRWGANCRGQGPDDRPSLPKMP